MELSVGIKGCAECSVRPENTAAAVGSGALAVFSTPSMVALMEKAALESVGPFLDEGMTTVGIKLDIAHLAATPLGLQVRAESELVAVDGKLPKDTFVIGRHIMTCCADDIQYGGMVATWSNAHTLNSRDWAVVTAEIAFEHNKAYRGKGPVLHILSFSGAQPPEQQVATFY